MLGRRLTTDKHDNPIQNVRGWYASEKFDGYRCFWDGKRLTSRSGRTIRCPSWFTHGFPSRCHMDGELFAGYRTRTKLSGITRNPNNPWWRRVRYMVFDLPNSRPFKDRISCLKNISNSGTLATVLYRRVTSAKQLRKFFKAIITRGGEGVILREPNSLYKQGRSSLFLKYLPWQPHVVKGE